MLRTICAAFLLAIVVACAAPPRTTDSVRPLERRIISLTPAFTEDLFAIGAGKQVVGVSAYTDWPAQAKKLPQVADFSSIDAERAIQLHPDLVVAIRSQARLLEPLQRAGLRVRMLPGDSYADIFTAINDLGEETGHSVQAHALIATLQRQTSRIHFETRAYRRRPSVFVALGTGPVWTAGASSYIATLIRLAGGVDAAADLHAPYGEYSSEALLKAQPDAIVYGDETSLPSVFNREPWRSLRAVREHHVYKLQDSDLLYRPGPRYIEGLHWLLARLKPLSM